jgi:hypothetical protein
MRTKGGALQRMMVPPFMPKRITDPYHPGGNSLCYMIQTAHLMGCSPIYCLGFTLENGTGYFFGLENPVTNRRSFYADPVRAIEWLRWYRSQWPGRVKLWPGWSGPVYEALEVVTDDEAQQLIRGAPEFRGLQSVEVVSGQPPAHARAGVDRPQPAAQRPQPAPPGGKRLPHHRQGGVIRGGQQ